MYYKRYLQNNQINSELPSKIGKMKSLIKLYEKKIFLS